MGHCRKFGLNTKVGERSSSKGDQLEAIATDKQLEGRDRVDLGTNHL